MNDPHGQQFDQILASTRDDLPRIWWAVYKGSLDAGFNERQAFALVTTFILSQGSSDVRPNDPIPPTNPEQP